MLKPYNLAAQHPDDFIVDLLDLYPASVLEAAASHRRSLKNPPKTADEYLDTLRARGLTQSVAVMRQWTVAMPTAEGRIDGQEDPDQRTLSAPG